MCSLAFKAGMFVFALGGAAFGTWVVYSVVVPKNIREQLEGDGFRVLDTEEEKNKLLTFEYLSRHEEQLKKFLRITGLNFGKEVVLEKTKTKCSEIMDVKKGDENWASILGDAKLFCSVME